MTALSHLLRAVCCGLLPGLACAAPAPLVLAFSTLPPWKIINADGRASGPYLDIVRVLAERVGHPLQLRRCPLPRCLALAASGEVDLMIGVRSRPGRDDKLDFLSPPFAGGTPLSFIQRRADGRPLRNYGDLQSLRIGVVEGSTYFERFDSDRSLIRDPAPDSQSSLRKLLAGRVDTAIFNYGQAKWMLEHMSSGAGLKFAAYRVHNSELRRVALVRASPFYSLKPRLELALDGMVKDGTVHRLLAPIEEAPVSSR
ncbi:substrate-binding periplasmic protein [Paludibacterium yongneupense]|uniref:substrate-binding periplasmic protein n=1 Tax=Paludibacterium yongneupense TaxID=400061 RepID=UPI000403B598|nr:transporter substrate-binding domain-containing protein [Paludibacterium yongneupense]